MMISQDTEDLSAIVMAISLCGGAMSKKLDDLTALAVKLISVASCWFRKSRSFRRPLQVRYTPCLPAEHASLMDRIAIAPHRTCKADASPLIIADEAQNDEYRWSVWQLVWISRWLCQWSSLSDLPPHRSKQFSRTNLSGGNVARSLSYGGLLMGQKSGRCR